MRAIITVFGCSLAVACAARHASVTEPPEPALSVVAAPLPPAAAPVPTTGDMWQVTLLIVAPLAQRGDFVTADSVLATFASRHAGTCEAAESGYVSALLRLSPNNANAKVASALPLLDSYLGSRCIAPTRAAEVLLVRRAVADLMRQNFAGDSASSEEIRKLKEQLELSKKELDRLKMRVITPPP